MNNATIELLDRLGARVDLTLEPGQRVVSIGDLKERFTASLPDYAGVPSVLNRPSVHDFRKKSLWRKRALWMIPVSTGSIEWSAGVDWRLTSRPWMLMRTLKRRALDRSTGSIMTKPNPVRANYQSELAVTTVIWTSENTKAVEVHVGSPDGPSFTRGDCSGSATTGKWVTDGMRFYLQDVSGMDWISTRRIRWRPRRLTWFRRGRRGTFEPGQRGGWAFLKLSYDLEPGSQFGRILPNNGYTLER